MKENIKKLIELLGRKKALTEAELKEFLSSEDLNMLELFKNYDTALGTQDYNIALNILSASRDLYLKSDGLYGANFLKLYKFILEKYKGYIDNLKLLLDGELLSIGNNSILIKAYRNNDQDLIKFIQENGAITITDTRDRMEVLNEIFSQQKDSFIELMKLFVDTLEKNDKEDLGGVALAAYVMNKYKMDVNKLDYLYTHFCWKLKARKIKIGDDHDFDQFFQIELLCTREDLYNKSLHYFSRNNEARNEQDILYKILQNIAPNVHKDIIKHTLINYVDFKGMTNLVKARFFAKREILEEDKKEGLDDNKIKSNLDDKEKEEKKKIIPGKESCEDPNKDKDNDDDNGDSNNDGKPNGGGDGANRTTQKLENDKNGKYYIDTKGDRIDKMTEEKDSLNEEQIGKEDLQEKSALNSDLTVLEISNLETTVNMSSLAKENEIRTLPILFMFSSKEDIALVSGYTDGNEQPFSEELYSAMPIEYSIF